jgi:hypothetical protein
MAQLIDDPVHFIFNNMVYSLAPLANYLYL